MVVRVDFSAVIDLFAHPSHRISYSNVSAAHTKQLHIKEQEAHVPSVTELFAFLSENLVFFRFYMMDFYARSDNGNPKPITHSDLDYADYFSFVTAFISSNFSDFLIKQIH